MTAFPLATPDATHSVLCTTLHGLIDNQGWGFAGSAIKNVEVFIQRDPTMQRENLWEKFVTLSEGDEDMKSGGFESMSVVEESLTERVMCLKELKEENMTEALFLDP